MFVAPRLRTCLQLVCSLAVSYHLLLYKTSKNMLMKVSVAQHTSIYLLFRSENNYVYEEVGIFRVGSTWSSLGDTLIALQMCIFIRKLVQMQLSIIEDSNNRKIVQSLRSRSRTPSPQPLRSTVSTPKKAKVSSTRSGSAPVIKTSLKKQMFTI